GMAHQAAGSGLALGSQSRFNRDNWLEKNQDFPRKNVFTVMVAALLHRRMNQSLPKVPLKMAQLISFQYITTRSERRFEPTGTNGIGHEHGNGHASDSARNG